MFYEIFVKENIDNNSINYKIIKNINDKIKYEDLFDYIYNNEIIIPLLCGASYFCEFSNINLKNLLEIYDIKMIDDDKFNNFKENDIIYI